MEPWVQCASAKGGEQGLWQLGLCIGKSSLRPFECNAQTLAKGSCSASKPIRYTPMPADGTSMAKEAEVGGQASGIAPPVEMAASALQR
eukprot:1988032-Pyramimonas_sp.AAC.3